MSKTKKPPVAAVQAAIKPKPWIGALSTTLIVAMLCVTVVWATPRPIGDLFVAFAVGRDILDGKLGKPDDWSFTVPEGKVCFNQNWGTHLLHYLTYMYTGETGLLMLKFALVAGAAVFVVLAARQRNVRWPVAFLVAGGVIAASRSYVDLRPNLTTLMLAPLVLWLLFKTRKNVHWIWLVMVLNGIWANVHGGFIFGLGMISLWTFCRLLNDVLSIGFKPAIEKCWPLLAATVGSILLATFVNPYGPPNLLFPLTIRDPAWQKLNEWQPLLPDHPVAFGTTWEFFVVAGLLAALLLVRVMGIPGLKRSHMSRPTAESTTMTLFDLGLAAVLVYMTFTARRFVPLSVILLGPFLAIQVEWLLRMIGLPKVILVFSAALAVPVLLYGHDLYLVYRDDNPTRQKESILNRMSGVSMLPVNAGKFLQANNINGNAYHEWRWEGYLHWTNPQIKLFLGGRAHQVYDGSVDKLNMRILTPGTDSVAILSKLDCHLAVLPIGEVLNIIQRNLLETPNAHWAYIYFDGLDAVLADANHSYTMDLIRRATEGRLVYPNPAAAALSKAMAMSASCLNYPRKDIINAFSQAAEANPLAFTYNAIIQLAVSEPGGQEFLKGYLPGQYDRLKTIDTNRPDGFRILQSRAVVTNALMRLCANGPESESARWQQVLNETRKKLTAMQEDWR